MVDGDSLMMHTQPMSPVLGATAIGGAVAGAGGAAAGGVLGLAKEFFVRDNVVIACDLVEVEESEND